jgi:hypothetical protein
MHASAAMPMSEAANRSPCNASNSWATINTSTTDDAVMRMTNWRLADLSFVRPCTTESCPTSARPNHHQRQIRSSGESN